MKTDHGVTVRVENCGKTFADGTRALEPVTLDIARGETLVLLGPSGCGKTTMLRIIAGLEAPDAGGHVLFNGSDVTTTPIEQRNVGMVFQSYALFPNMSVAENIGYGLKIRGSARPNGKRALPNWSSSPASRASNTGALINCPADNVSAWPWPAPSQCAPACCCSTSR